MSSGTFTPTRRTVRHRRRSNVIATVLTPQPIDDPHITFRNVTDDISGDVVGTEAVYVPLEVDPNLSRWSNFLTVPLATRPELAYACMTVHVLYLLRLRDTMELFHYLMDGMNPHRFDNRVLNLSVDALRDGRITYIPNGEITAVTLPAYASSQIRVLYCFIQYIKYLYKITDRQFDIRMFRLDQFDDFRTNLYDPDHPIYEDIGWLSNRNNMVEEYLASKEEQAKRRSPAAEFQRQIKFDISAYPKLLKEKHYATWNREFKAIATAQGLSDVLDITIDPTTLDLPSQELDRTKNQAMYPVFQRTLMTSATKSIVLKQESTGCSSRETYLSFSGEATPYSVESRGNLMVERGVFYPVYWIIGSAISIASTSPPFPKKGERQ